MINVRASGRWGAAVLPVLALGLTIFHNTPLAHAGDDPVLTSVTAVFDTTTNDKDHDTYLDVLVYNNRGTLIAQKRGIGGHWNDHSSNTVALDLTNTLRKTQIPAGRVRLDIHPNGNDKWEFNYHLDLTYQDGSVTEASWDGKVLTQDNPTTIDSWNGQ